MIRSKDVPLLKRLNCYNLDEDLRDRILSFIRKRKIVDIPKLKREIALCCILQHNRTSHGVIY